MYYQSEDIRGSTLAISESLKYRKTCLMNHSPSKKYNPTIKNDENFSPLFQTQTKNRNNSIQMRKQSRRKTGSIGKIVRNNHSNEKNTGFQDRIPLTQANNYLNQKLQFQKGNQNVGIYKKLYQQNKVLNEALKSKIYQTPQSNSYKNSLMNMSYYQPDSRNMTKTYNSNLINQEKNYNKNLGLGNSHNKQLQTKYQQMLAEYDKKKNFIKQEIQALKQKTTIENFSSTKNPTQQTSKQLNYQYNSRGNESYNNSKVNQQKVNLKSQTMSKGFGLYNTRAEQNLNKQTESQIDSKFKAYQQKVQRHKEFQKRNSSVNKYSQGIHGQKQKSSFQSNQFNNQSLFQQLRTAQKSIKKSSQNNTIKIFADLIMKQIQKDEQVRNIKNNLKNFSIQEIQKILKERYSFNIDLSKLKLSTQQYDPFFQQKQSQKSIDKLAWQFMNAYEIAENFWKNIIVGKFNSQELEKIYDTLNYSKKEKIQLNEFCRQISFHLNKTIRGRQIYSSYQRLSPLTRQNFVFKLSKKQ